MENCALIVAEKLDIAVVFSETGMTKLLKEIETKAMAHVPDIDSEQGRKDIVSMAYKVTRSKTLIDDLGKGVVSDWKKKAKAIDGHRKIARNFLDNLKDQVRQPLADWETKQITIEKEAEMLEQIKTDDRVTSLFAVGVNIPYFEAAMMSDEEYSLMLDVAINDHNTERLRLQEEQKTKEAEAAKLELERAEIARIQKEQETRVKAQADKEKALEDERKAFEAEKKVAIERKEKEAWEKRETERLRIQADENAAEAEKVRIAKEKSDREAKELELKELRLEALEEIGFEYPFNDLGIMPDKQYTELYNEHRKAWDTKQKVLLIEKIEKERIEKEKFAAAEKARTAELQPDKDRLINYANELAIMIGPKVKNKAAHKIIIKAEARIADIAKDIIKQTKEL